MNRWGLPVLVAVLLAAGLPACSRPTEVMVIIDTDIPWGQGQDLTGLLVTVRSDGPEGVARDSRAYALGLQPGRTRLPASFGIVPLGGDATRTFWVEVLGCGGSGCSTTGSPNVIVAQRAIVGFVPGQTLALRMFLADGCRNVTCPTNQTCSPGVGCVSAVVNTGSLMPFDPDASMRVDAHYDGLIFDTPADAPADTGDAGVVPPVQIAAGGAHACALGADGVVRCWGDNRSYQNALDFPTAAVMSPHNIGLATRAEQLAVGGATTCAIDVNHALWCVGLNDHGQLGRGSPMYMASILEQPSGSPNVLSADMGTGHGCAIVTGGAVYCWGGNGAGQIGDGTHVDHQRPLPTPIVSGARQVECGADHTCVLLTDGTVQCWGANDSGQLGDGTMIARARPTPTLAMPEQVVEIRAGFKFTCARLASGLVRCWGRSVGNGSGHGDTSMPGQVPTLVGVTSLAAGTDHVCAVDSMHRLFCWGLNEHGELGVAGLHYTPVEVASIGRVTSAACGERFTCAIRDDGTTACWGVNHMGQLGNGTSTAFTPTPTAIAGAPSGISAIAIGANHMGFVLAGTTVHAWGAGTSGGEFGPGGSTSNTPVVVNTGSPEVGLCAGLGYACAVDMGGTGVRCWGRNENGQLGRGNNQPVVDIAAVTTNPPVSSISCHHQHTCIIQGGVTAACWGANEAGEIGTRSLTPGFYSVPTPVSFTGVRPNGIWAGSGWTCWGDGVGIGCWGGNGYSPTSPVSLRISAPSFVSLGESHGCAVSSGQAVCWGNNTYGALGVSNPAERGPITVPGETNVREVAAGSSLSCSLRMNGTVACWGLNTFGQVGAGTYVPLAVFTPSVVAGINDGLHISATDDAVCVARSSGITCWGALPTTGLGDGHTMDLLAPVTVVGLP